MIDKKAAADHKITELIAERWSPRAFSDKNLEPEKILSLFEAARWAPSAFNEQPWRFITASKSDPQEFEKMLSCLAKSNQVWAKRAQMLIILVVKNKFDYNGKPNRWAMHDCGLALENLLLEAAAQGLQGHPMAGFSTDAVRETYGVPEDYEPLVAVAVDYVGEPELLEGELRDRELDKRERLPLDGFVFEGKWRQPIKK
ncbi:MAG: nitroreductase family protein [Cloacibacillus porcorum]|uniref:nitroreductase family protein n=1 Tax=Cloacibacillus porcorum TaxID=1197717 RepID=UPI00235671E7|nr:nitroreductase family protein [Cloacibacillus porcorum]MCI5865841.1 nitroreductase family protein [Cloacibacillus porcorum]